MEITEEKQIGIYPCTKEELDERFNFLEQSPPAATLENGILNKINLYYANHVYIGITLCERNSSFTLYRKVKLDRLVLFLNHINIAVFYNLNEAQKRKNFQHKFYQGTREIEAYDITKFTNLPVRLIKKNGVVIGLGNFMLDSFIVFEDYLDTDGDI